MGFFKLFLLLGLLSITSAQVVLPLLSTTFTTAFYAEKFGFRIEDVSVTTSDGYKLTIHHLGKDNVNTTGRQPVFLMHGIICSSAVWNTWQDSIAYYLFNQGYDVWMGNARGNQYSLGHVSLLSDVPGPYWAFSWDQIALIDIPTMMDRVSEITGFASMPYVGHSQGTTTGVALMAAQPNYPRISSLQLLAPVIFLEHVNGTNAAAVKLLLGAANPLAATFGAPLLPNTFLNPAPVCAVGVSCEALINLIFGPSENYEQSIIPDIVRTIPAGSSTNQLQQYAQLVGTTRFGKLDYGSVENLRQYGSAIPTNYNLGNVKIPTYLYTASGDYLSTTDDVSRFASLLAPGALRGMKLYEEWHHLDYLYGAQIAQILNPEVLKNIRAVSNSN